MQFKAMFLHENVSIFVPAGGRATATARARANAMTGNKVSAQNQMDVVYGHLFLANLSILAEDI